MSKQVDPDKSVAKLVADVESLKVDTAKHSEMLMGQSKVLAEHSEILADLRETLEKHTAMFEELQASIRAISTSTASMASAVTQAVSQLTVAQSHERRLERLEAAVFPPKH